MPLNLQTPTAYTGKRATQYRQGAVRFATDEEALAGDATNVAITPAQLAAVTAVNLSTPTPIGNTTPNTGAFTTLKSTSFALPRGTTSASGTAVLVNGTVTVANTNIAAGDEIIISRKAVNASTTLGELTYSISAGASFTITSAILGTPGSTQTGDLSTVFYQITKTA